MTAPTKRTLESCALHAYHRPAVDHNELHHVIPQGWQATWRPPNATRVLWAPTTVALCPTGHRNVHAILERAMRWLATSPGPIDATQLKHAITAARHPKRLGNDEAMVALTAMLGFQKNGGDLRTLIAAKEWGQG